MAAPFGTGVTKSSHAARYLLVVLPGYVILGTSLLASLELRSAPAVVIVAMLTAGLTGVLCSEFSTFQAKGGGFSIEARRKKQQKKLSAKKRVAPALTRAKRPLSRARRPQTAPPS